MMEFSRITKDFEEVGEKLQETIRYYSSPAEKRGKLGELFVLFKIKSFNL